MESVEQRGRRVRSGAVREALLLLRDSAEPHREDESGASYWIKAREFPGYWRTCRARIQLESTSYHNRPESLLVTHLLPLPRPVG